MVLESLPKLMPNGAIEQVPAERFNNFRGYARLLLVRKRGSYPRVRIDAKRGTS